MRTRTVDRPRAFSFLHPSVADVGSILPLMHLDLAADVPPHASIVDLRYLDDADPSAFHVLARYLKDNAELIGERHTQVALIRPRGYFGMIVAGFHDVIGGQYEVRVFEDLAAGAEWATAGDLVAELDDVITRASQSSAAVVSLRRWLDDHVAGATLESAARAIARAPRSLQRDLQEAGSSFQRELEAARVRCTKRLLAHTDSSLTEIAYDIAARLRSTSACCSAG